MDTIWVIGWGIIIAANNMQICAAIGRRDCRRPRANRAAAPTRGIPGHDGHSRDRNGPRGLLVARLERVGRAGRRMGHWTTAAGEFIYYLLFIYFIC